MAKDSNISRLDQLADSNPDFRTEGSQRFHAWMARNRTTLPDGPGYGRAFRTAELDSFPTPEKPRLLRHHVQAAATSLKLDCATLTNPIFVEYGEDRRTVMKGIRAIPSSQRERLDPVFQHCSLWADGEKHRRRFDCWELDLTDTLDLIDGAEVGGRGKFIRLHKNYVRTLEDHQVILTALYSDMLDALGGTFPI